MKSEYDIKTRLVETIGDIRRLDNKDELFCNLSCEEYEVLDSLRAEHIALRWVLSDSE